MTTLNATPEEKRGLYRVVRGFFAGAVFRLFFINGGRADGRLEEDFSKDGVTFKRGSILVAPLEDLEEIPGTAGEYRRGVLDARAMILKDRDEQLSLARSAAEVGNSAGEATHATLAAQLGVTAARVLVLTAPQGDFSEGSIRVEK